LKSIEPAPNSRRQVRRGALAEGGAASNGNEQRRPW